MIKPWSAVRGELHIFKKASLSSVTAHGNEPFLRKSCNKSSLPVQNGCDLADNILKCIFVKEKFCISVKIPVKFVP